MKNGTEKYIETVAYLGKLYDFANAELFGGELIKPVITVQTDERNKTNGWWSLGKVWKENGEDDGEHELNMTAQQLHRPINEIAATLIHEMCHQYATVHEMKDTSRSGNYHNKLFKKIAEAHGLNVECVPKIGWSHTTLTDETAEAHGLNVECVPKIGWSHTTLTDETAAKITSFTTENPPTVIYRLPVAKGQTVKTTSTRKYVCPCCGQSVRATKRVNIMCLDCNEPMQEEE